MQSCKGAFLSSYTFFLNQCKHSIMHIYIDFFHQVIIERFTVLAGSFQSAVQQKGSYIFTTSLFFVFCRILPTHHSDEPHEHSAVHTKCIQSL